jgi:hypothetical protein
MHIKPYLLIACGLMAILFGVAGYYAGYRAACMEFAEQWTAEALNDRVASAVYSLYADEGQGEEEDNQENMPGEQEAQDASDATPGGRSEESIEESTHESSITYEAHLAGFGTSGAADRYVLRLKAEGIAAHVVKRDTVNSRRRHITWYQVVTDPLPYDQLLTIVALLKKRDKLEGVAIVEKGEAGNEHKKYPRKEEREEHETSE